MNEHGCDVDDCMDLIVQDTLEAKPRDEMTALYDVLRMHSARAMWRRFIDLLNANATLQEHGTFAAVVVRRASAVSPGTGSASWATARRRTTRC